MIMLRTIAIVATVATTLAQAVSAQDSGKIGAWGFQTARDGEYIYTRATSVYYCLELSGIVQILCEDGALSVAVTLPCADGRPDANLLIVDEENNISMPMGRSNGEGKFTAARPEGAAFFGDLFSASGTVEARAGNSVTTFNFYGLDRALARTKTCKIGHLE
jgi:hypothetical protein